MKTIRVLLAEDHNVVREGLCLLLRAQPDIEVVCQATNGVEAVTAARETCPDVAVLDIAMPQLDGIEAATRIRTECPNTRILMLSMHESDAYFFRAVNAGASGYILKKAASEELIDAVRAVAGGDAYFYAPMARKLLDGYLGHIKPEAVTGPPGYDELSEREREIMLLLVGGLSNQAIADQLVISASTVQSHRASILQKLGLDNTIDLVRYAIRHGIIEA
jgi:NarL family two-component system response regulator LiaR